MPIELQYNGSKDQEGFEMGRKGIGNGLKNVKFVVNDFTNRYIFDKNLL